MSLAASADIERERKQLDDHWQQRLARSRYEVEQARRQYAAVDPEHRLVARELERRWDEALRAEEQLQADYAAFPAAIARHNFPASEREAILALSQDLPALWYAETTTPEDRQTVARLLLEQVTVTVEGNTDRVDVELRWAGGFVSRRTLSRPVQTYEQLSNYKELVARIDALRAEGKTLSEIAATLNAEGFHPPKRTRQFTKAILSRFLRERGVRTGALPRSVTSGEHLRSERMVAGGSGCKTGDADRDAPSLAACRLGHLAQSDGGGRSLGDLRRRRRSRFASAASATRHAGGLSLTRQN